MYVCVETASIFKHFVCFDRKKKKGMRPERQQLIRKRVLWSFGYTVKEKKKEESMWDSTLKCFLHKMAGRKIETRKIVILLIKRLKCFLFNVILFFI